MNLLDKRPLSIVLVIMLGGLVFYAYSDYRMSAGFILLSVALMLAVAFILTLVLLKKKKFILLVSSVSLLFTLLFSFLYFELWFKAYDRFDGEVTVSGMVSSVETTALYNVRVTIKASNINDEPFSAYKLMLELDQKDAEYLSVGAVVTFKCKLNEFENFSDSFDSKKYYASLGYSAKSDTVSDIKVIEYTNGGIEEKLTHWRDILSRRSIMLSDGESGSFLAGLLLGERKYLDGKVGFDFTRSGVSHILALSGMHFVILGMGIERLLSLVNVNKRWQKAAIIVFAIAYTALTGCAPSVLRAGIMLIIASLLYLVCGSRDSLTNAFLSCALICFVTPYSVFSMSLWLSVFATLGIIGMGEFLVEKEHKNLISRFGNWIWEAFVATFFAVGATFCITATTFSGTANMMIPANLICGPLSDAYLYIGSAALVIGDIIPIGKLLIPLFKIISYFIDLTASPKLGYVSIGFDAISVIIIIFSVLYFIFLFFKIKHKRIFLSILLVLFISVFAIATVLTHINYNNDAIIYGGSQEHDTMLVKSNGEIMLIDSTSYSKSSAYNTVEYLKNEDVFYLDKYVVTHYSKKLDDMICTLVINIRTDEVYLPYPENEDEIFMADAIIEILKKHKIAPRFYLNGAIISHGKYEFTRHYNIPYGEGTATCAYTLDSKNQRTLYLSSGMLTGKAKETATELIAESTALLLGCHGKSYGNLTYFECYNDSLQHIVIGSNYLALTQDCYIYYEKLGCSVEAHPQRVELYVE